MQIKSICVFCSSSQSVSKVYKEVAADLGRIMGHSKIDLIYGGAAIGLMGCIARGVHVAGGNVIGVLPHFFMNKDISF